MFKLFLTVVAMSDTGSISTAILATDYPSRSACERALVDIAPEKLEKELAGHRFVVSTNASCKPAWAFGGFPQ